MLFGRHGVLLGILLFLGCHVVEVIAQNNDSWNTLCMSDQVDTDQGLFAVCRAVLQEIDGIESRSITMLDIARGSISQEQFCQW